MTTPSWLPKPQHREGSRVEPGGLPAGGRQSGTREDLPAAGTGAESRRREGCTETNPDAGSPPSPSPGAQCPGDLGGSAEHRSELPWREGAESQEFILPLPIHQGLQKSQRGNQSGCVSGTDNDLSIPDLPRVCFLFFFPPHELAMNFIKCVSHIYR